MIATIEPLNKGLSPRGGRAAVSARPPLASNALTKTPRELRQDRLGHRGVVIWLTGLSGAGKSTLANALECRLLHAGLLPSVLDGDLTRRGLCRGLGFSESDRKENIRRVSETALLMADAGVIVIAALISPYLADRQIAADRCNAHGIPFAEVYVNAPLAVCERRDPKHLYQKARRGELAEFTGISAPYEPPVAPALELHTDGESIDASVDRLAQLTLALASLQSARLDGSGAGI